MTAEASVREKKPLAPWLSTLLIGLRLLIVCAVVAGVVSFVRTLTKPKADENLLGTKRQAISDIFGIENPKFVEDDGFYVVSDYTTERGEYVAGYCVESTAGGFGGDLTLMVGYGTDGTILGVQIVSHAETPGVGAKVKDDPAFLEQYVGKSGELILNKDGGSDVDAISGATISSRAVNEAINRATETLREKLTQTAGGDAQ